MRHFLHRSIAACSVILFLLAATALNAQPTAATAELPTTPAAKVFSAWLAAFNSADIAQFKAFDDKYKPNPPMAGDADFRKMTGGFTLVRVESSEPTKLVALMKEGASENMGRLQLTVSAEGSPKVLSLDIRLVPAPDARSGPPSAPVTRLTLEETIAATNKRIDELVAADQFSGAILIAQHGKTLMTRAVGMENREKSVTNSLDTKFRIGSMNKMFTAVATLQLVERGKLSLDDTIGKHLADYPNKEIASKVTIRQLLTHTGGTGDIFGPEFEKNRLTLKTPSDYVKLYGNRAPAFAPGSEHRYSNYGYVLLGAIIEKLSGQSYDQHMQQNVFAPAGMKDTGALPESQPVAKRAVGYMRPQGKWVPNTETLSWSGSPAGGGYSTVTDMMRFAMALEGGQLISKAMLIDATTPKEKNYGFGFGVRGGGQRIAFGHGGGAPGINGKLLVFPAGGYVIVALGNLDPPSAEQLVDFVAARLPAKETSAATTGAPVDRTEVPMNTNSKRPTIAARLNGCEPKMRESVECVCGAILGSTHPHCVGPLHSTSDLRHIRVRGNPRLDASPLRGAPATGLGLLLPLNRRGRFSADVVHHAVEPPHFVDDAVGDFAEQ
jgi:D-alanyl-D-alanine carboxypeptidase